MKQLANGITVSRIVASLALLLTEPLSAWFYGLFVFCGLTDMTDGFVARRTGGESRARALLFLLPLRMGVLDLRYSAAFVCAVATFAAVQEGHFIRAGKYCA